MVTPELSEREGCWLEDFVAVMVLMDAIAANSPAPEPALDLSDLRVILAKINKATGSYLPSGTLP